ILPLAVILKRLAAPRCVFSFFFGLVEFLGIANLLKRQPESLHLRGLLRAWLGGTCAFFRRQQRYQDISFHARHGFNLAKITDFAEQPGHLRAPHFLVSHFAAAMKNHGANFVAFAEEPDDLILANLIVVLGCGRAKLDFFKLRTAAALSLLVRLLI